jgi:hypothetical protein
MLGRGSESVKKSAGSIREVAYNKSEQKDGLGMHKSQGRAFLRENTITGKNTERIGFLTMKSMKDKKYRQKQN